MNNGRVSKLSLTVFGIIAAALLMMGIPEAFSEYRIVKDCTYSVTASRSSKPSEHVFSSGRGRPRCRVFYTYDYKGEEHEISKTYLEDETSVDPKLSLLIDPQHPGIYVFADNKYGSVINYKIIGGGIFALFVVVGAFVNAKSKGSYY